MLLEENIVLLTQQYCGSLKPTISVLNKEIHQRITCFDIDLYTSSISSLISDLKHLFQEGGSLLNSRYQHVVLLVPQAIELLRNLQRFSSFYNNVNFITVGLSHYLHVNIIKKEFTNFWITNIEYKEYFKNFRNNFTSIVDEESALIHSNRQENKHVRAVSMIYPPYIVLVDALEGVTNTTCRVGHPCKYPEKQPNGTVSWTQKCCSGLVLDIFITVSQKLEFDFDLHIVEDGAFGILKNGAWNGMVNDLVMNKADVAIHALIPLEIRAQYIRFSPSMFVSHYVVVTRRKVIKKEIIDWSFMDPLQSSLIIAILVCIIAVYFTIGILENAKYNFLNVGKPLPLTELMVYLGGLIFQRDLGGKNPRVWSARIVALSFSAAMMILMSTYTAYITASKINISENDDFKGLTDEKVRYFKLEIEIVMNKLSHNNQFLF